MSKLISKKVKHSENHLDVDTPKWFAVYTPYKREKIARQHLTNHGIETYLPLQKLTKRYSKKIKKVELPLINHYLFVKITKKEYTKVLQCPYVVHFVKFSNNIISIPEHEINLLKRILGELDSVEMADNNYQKGDRVEVIGGNLTGIKGMLIKKENNQYFCVKLENLGISINVSIAAHLLRKTKSIEPVLS